MPISRMKSINQTSKISSQPKFLKDQDKNQSNALPYSISQTPPQTQKAQLTIGRHQSKAKAERAKGGLKLT